MIIIIFITKIHSYRKITWTSRSSVTMANVHTDKCALVIYPAIQASVVHSLSLSYYVKYYDHLRLSNIVS